MTTKGRAWGTMRGMRHLAKLPCMAALAFLTGMGAFSACSSDGKTVVALTINSDDTVGIVDQILVTVSSNMPTTKMVAPNKNPDSGVIAASFFTRLELEGHSGKVTLKVDAMDSGGAIIATATTDEFELREHGAVAARVSLSTKKPPMDAGGSPDTGAADGGAGDAETD
jgi:hypothetical protein